MFYDVIVNNWGETTYVPTTLGNVCLVILILVLLFLAAGFIQKRSRKLSVQQLAFCAVSIALGTVLSNIKVFSFPTGGSITLLSMLVICLPGYWFGLGVGILTGVAYGVLQMLVDPYILFPAQLIVDYLLAFGALGLSGLFCKRKHGLIPGYILAVLGRYTFAVLSGWLFFGMYAWEGWNPLPYSLAYNAIYIFAEAGVTIVVLLLPPVRKALEMVKKQAV
ncbi:MAG: energy-coupled thiamine transporter ThiT [Lachnospiraceae bacterium]|nr:energy-coupled thiamine transporter ThiT [Lachnospiraceae bacterium]MBR4082703.1 energy-coupled thiamine transporter ThiT [Lachnospiraceae bacterium]